MRRYPLPRRPSPSLPALVLGFVFAFPAAAQLEHGFVEPCTMSNVAERHLDCEACPSAFGSRQCEERLKPRGYTRKCRTQAGHSGWEEIWCAPRAPAKPPPDQTIWVVLGAAGAVAGMALVMRMISGKKPT